MGNKADKFFKKFKTFLLNLKIYSQITDLSSVSRRYFVIGYFDGVLTIMGFVVGAHLSGKVTSELMIGAGFATALALAISSGFGAYEAEIVEQHIRKREIDKAMLREVGGIIESAHKVAIYVSAFVHAVAPLVGGLIPILPYLIFTPDVAYIYSLAIGFVSLFIVGFAFGKVAKMNVIISGLKFVLAGLLTLIAVTILHPIA